MSDDYDDDDGSDTQQNCSSESRVSDDEGGCVLQCNAVMQGAAASL